MGFGCGETWDGIATLPLLTGYISQPLRVSASYLNTVKVKWPNGLYNLFFFLKKRENEKYVFQMSGTVYSTQKELQNDG